MLVLIAIQFCSLMGIVRVPILKKMGGNVV